MGVAVAACDGLNLILGGNSSIAARSLNTADCGHSAKDRFQENTSRWLNGKDAPAAVVTAGRDLRQQSAKTPSRDLFEMIGKCRQLVSVVRSHRAGGCVFEATNFGTFIRIGIFFGTGQWRSAVLRVRWWCDQPFFVSAVTAANHKLCVDWKCLSSGLLDGAGGPLPNGRRPYRSPHELRQAE